MSNSGSHLHANIHGIIISTGIALLAVDWHCKTGGLGQLFTRTYVKHN